MFAKRKRGRPKGGYKPAVWKSLGDAMEADGFNDETLAEKMGVQPGTIQFWRLGYRVPDESGIELLASHLPSTTAAKLKKDAPLKPSRNRYTQ